MKPLGIVLLFINLLAAAGVAYLAAGAWANKHEQNTAVLKHELVIRGMPTDASGSTAVPSDDDATVPLYGREVKAKVLKAHFAGSPRGGAFAGMSGTPPLSVVAEVTDMKKQLDAELASKPNDAAKIAYLVGTPGQPGPLTLLADDFEERAAFREWLGEAQNPQNPNVFPVGELLELARAALDAKFALATDKPSVSQANDYEAAKLAARAARDAAFDDYQAAERAVGLAAKQQAYLEAKKAYWKALVGKSAALSDLDRRRLAAGLLAVLDPSAGGQKRTAQLVGLSDYADAVLARTQHLSAMPERYDRQGESELTSFGLTYKQRLNTSKDLDFMLQRQLDITRSFAAQEKIAANQVATRTTHRDAALGRVDDLNKELKAAAAAQDALEAEIFTLQKLAAARFEQLFQLEDQVFLAEKQKAGQ